MISGWNVSLVRSVCGVYILTIVTHCNQHFVALPTKRPIILTVPGHPGSGCHASIVYSIESTQIYTIQCPAMHAHAKCSSS